MKIQNYVKSYKYLALANNQMMKVFIRIVQKTKLVKKFIFLLIHGPSLGIGAAIASIVIIVVFLGFQGSNQQELKIEPTPQIQESGPPKITMNTFLANSSPLLGNSNASVTLVEFGDYQCHFCNVFFHTTEHRILEKYVETVKVKDDFQRLQHHRS